MSADAMTLIDADSPPRVPGKVNITDPAMPALKGTVSPDDELPGVRKAEPGDLKSTGGHVPDKVEGFAIMLSGTGFVVTDNDGVDDHSGKAMFFSVGQMQDPS
ncbi:hypothetical protein [Roseobacter ponti]|uniref:Uncharacterized protein n=1 Tax=Roseobacter ponti TaxID=1891787 RepID=A0A858SX29_9RHOB|nr:hypothetical protein [Roseobacter ponti]QJF52830.1 hypothetical protein G3256_17450 [Roseobacter ponti]